MPSSTLTYLQHISTTQVECLICKDPVTADAVNLSCHENILFCAECIGHWLDHTMRIRDFKVSCPACRNRVDYSNLQVPQQSLEYHETLEMMDDEDEEYNSSVADSDRDIEDSEIEDEDENDEVAMEGDEYELLDSEDNEEEGELVDSDL